MRNAHYCIMLFFGVTLVFGARAAVAQENIGVTVVPDGGGGFKGKGTDELFPVEITVQAFGDGFRLSALGSGVRKKLIFKGYECIAYADKRINMGLDPYVTFIQGDFAKLVRMHFLRNVGGGKIRGFFRGGMKGVLGEGEWNEALASDFEVFLAFIGDEGMKDGESIQLIWLPGRGLFTMIGDKPHPPIRNTGLAMSLWAMWLGDNPVSGDLKKDMMRFTLEAP